VVARAFDSCFASLAVTAALALEFRDAPLPGALRPFGELIKKTVRSSARRVDVVGEPLRQIQLLFRAGSDEMTSTDFAALVPDFEATN
jgi:hypothetical protein